MSVLTTGSPMVGTPISLVQGLIRLGLMKDLNLAIAVHRPLKLLSSNNQHNNYALAHSHNKYLSSVDISFLSSKYAAFAWTKHLENLLISLASVKSSMESIHGSHA